ncbi:hypothetical protein KGF57_000501 [Candida theae]|uniref:Uncharacterized protein n=1 Tax=Candida theae TaxID=1198502 RepID=A0AAD5BIS2_9ASCO|nr:uncharacterized protein KGF57_000501 [Candida theae]KAI5967072.1 hypothetical protein KGF57_000501 [Candida theae]
MSNTDRSLNGDGSTSSPSDERNGASLVQNIGPIQDNEPWNDLSSPEPEASLSFSGLSNRSRTQVQEANNRQDVTSTATSLRETDQGFQTKEVPEWQKSATKTLVFVGYTITTVLFSVIIYLHSLLVRCSYDEETSTTLLDGVFRAQEKAIDDYHRRHRLQSEAEDEI